MSKQENKHSFTKINILLFRKNIKQRYLFQIANNLKRDIEENDTLVLILSNCIIYNFELIDINNYEATET